MWPLSSKSWATEWQRSQAHLVSIAQPWIYAISSNFDWERTMTNNCLIGHFSRNDLHVELLQITIASPLCNKSQAPVSTLPCAVGEKADVQMLPDVRQCCLVRHPGPAWCAWQGKTLGFPPLTLIQLPGEIVRKGIRTFDQGHVPKPMANRLKWRCNSEYQTALVWSSSPKHLQHHPPSITPTFPTSLTQPSKSGNVP